MKGYKVISERLLFCPIRKYQRIIRVDGLMYSSRGFCLHMYFTDKELFNNSILLCSLLSHMNQQYFKVQF